MTHKPEIGYTECWCPGCEEESHVIEVDDGIGWNEYWGYRSFDSRPRLATACCDECPMSLDNHTVELDYNDLVIHEPDYI